MLETFFRLGFHHLTEAGAWDHQLFLATIALAYPALMWKKWILMATLFAIGHTSAIVAMAAGVFPLDMPWVEPTIAGSIFVLALVDLYRVWTNPIGFEDPNWLRITMVLLVVSFGFVHGLGFGASFVTVMLQGLSSKEIALQLVSFTLGVEVAQLLILAVLWVVVYSLIDLMALPSKHVRIPILVLICLAALSIMKDVV